MTLRLRLTLLTSGVLLLGLLVFAGVAGVVLWRVELSSVARQVSAQAEALWAITETNPARLPTAAADVLEENGVTAAARVYDGGSRVWAGGADGPAVLDAAFLAAQDAPELLVRRAGDYLVASHQEGTVTVQVGRNLEPLESLLRRYALIAALTLLGLSLLGGLVAAGQVRRSLRPLTALAARVEHLDSPNPIPGLRAPDEVGALARALDGSLKALRDERERETLFLASASHELRTPVTAMLADVQHTLSRERPPQELHAALERTERTASRLRALTGNLMALTRAQRLPQPQPGDPQPEGGDAPLPGTDLLELAGEAVDLLQPLALRRSLDLWLDGQSVTVLGDRTLLGSVTENLIGNAVKFTPPGGEVQVRVSPTLRGGELTVQDSGPGFPDGALTEAFVRGDSGVEGFGLGLAVVRQVVEAYGGTLTLGAAPGGGARVTVSLPGSAAAARRPAPSG